MFKLGLEKAEEPDIKLPTFIGSKRKQGNSRKNVYFCLIDDSKAFDYVDHNKLWKILKEMGISILLLRSLHAGQDATARTLHGKLPGSKLEKGTTRLYILTLFVELIYRVSA